MSDADDAVTVEPQVTSVTVTPATTDVQVALAVTSIDVAPDVTQVDVTPSVTKVVVAPVGLPGLPGAAGPAGPQGPPGSSGSERSTFVQTNPSTMWHIVHGQGINPDVIVRRDDGVTIGAFGRIYSNDQNTVDLYFGMPTAGDAYLDF
jgi:hypothetical protein